MEVRDVASNNNMPSVIRYKNTILQELVGSVAPDIDQIIKANEMASINPQLLVLMDLWRSISNETSERTIILLYFLRMYQVYGRNMLAYFHWKYRTVPNLDSVSIARLIDKMILSEGHIEMRHLVDMVECLHYKQRKELFRWLLLYTGREEICYDSS